MFEEKQCQCCGIIFTPACHNTRQKFCSNECRIKYHNAKRYYGVPVGNCPMCGDTVEQSHEAGRWRRFCSDQCRIEYNRQKARERRQNRSPQVQTCPNCGKDFEVSWTPGAQRRFCCDTCRISWWQAYHKANPGESESETHCLACGQEIRGRHHGGKYCSRSCYLQAMAQTHCERICPWCGEAFAAYTGHDQTYCSRGCAAADRHAPKGVHRTKRPIAIQDSEVWREELTLAARGAEAPKRGQRVLLVRDAINLHIGLDGLVSIIRYQLKCNPYNGSVYVFRGESGNMLKYLKWDGASFCYSKRQTQRGTYPWPSSGLEAVVEISDKEFDYLLRKSMVATKKKRRRKRQKKG